MNDVEEHWWIETTGLIVESAIVNMKCKSVIFCNLKKSASVNCKILPLNYFRINEKRKKDKKRYGSTEFGI